MEENPTPAVEAQAPQTEATPTNFNQPAEAPAAPAETPRTPDLHGFTEEQLADMARFYAANGGFDAVKSKISNPQQIQQPEPQQQQSEQQQPKPAAPPDGYYSLQELNMKRFFRDLSEDPKYANISEQIKNGDVLKEMAKMGMHPIDENFNVNMDQLNDFLSLKSAAVPTKPTSVEPTNTPTVDYVPMEGDAITSMNQAIDIARQSTMLRAQGLQPHPGEQKALEYLKNNKFGQ